LMATGAFSPLNTFLGQADHESVLERMRLAGGQLFPIPITLPVPKDSPIKLDSDVALRDQRNELLAVMTVTEVYPWDRELTARHVCGTNDPRHPLVAEMQGWGPRNISGPLRVLSTPVHHDFTELRLTPAQTRERLKALGHANVVAFQTRNPLHRVHEEMLRRAATSIDGTILLHPAVGMTKPGDVDHYSRVRTYRVIADKYLPADRTLLSLIPLAMRMAGPREALWHALIRRNFGANHFIVGRDHAGPGADSKGKPFYGPDEARQLVEEHQDELGVKVVPFTEMVYLADEERYEERSRVTPTDRVLSISGTEARADYLERGRPLPAWFTRPEVSAILAETYLPRQRQGVCVWLTGLSCAGKSTIAEILTTLLLAAGRRVTLLDGDVVRQTLSHGLGFSNEDRDRNIRRIGYVAAEVVRHGGVAICAAISPYRATRDEVRGLAGPGNFVEVFVNTPLAVCEARDTKGLYAQARRGELSNFTDVNDPYEPPLDPELALGDGSSSADENARSIMNKLVQLGFVEE
ncbi:MAG: bifunctional sulfate adenylyltransferase/adenylylsulfate kinase, partial [Pyrinomonadaceae bacterium]